MFVSERQRGRLAGQEIDFPFISYYNHNKNQMKNKYAHSGAILT